MTASVAATWIEVGNTSLDDCEALTWSFGCTLRPSASVARLASTSLVFMLELVPDPVWKTSIGNSSSNSPAATRSAAPAIASATSCVHHAEPGVHPRRRALDQGERADLRALEAAAGDREVLDRPLGLRLVLGGSRDAHLAHRVVFDAVVTVAALTSGRDRGRAG